MFALHYVDSTPADGMPITTLDEIPALTRSWLAPLEKADPETWEELAESLVIAPAGSPAPDPGFPAGVGDVLARLDLADREIGAFRFAPAPGDTAAAQLIAFDAKIAAQFDIEGDARFIAAYGADLLVATPGGVVLLKQDGDYQLLAQDCGAFLVMQANAYDAYKRHIVKANDEAAYRAEAQTAAADPALANANAALIFESQLKA